MLGFVVTQPNLQNYGEHYNFRKIYWMEYTVARIVRSMKFQVEVQLTNKQRLDRHFCKHLDFLCKVPTFEVFPTHK